MQHIPKTNGDNPIQDTILGDKQLIFVGQVKPPNSFVILFFRCLTLLYEECKVQR